MKINKDHLTKEFCKNKILIFYPATREEAGQIQRNLFDLGFCWISGDRAISITSACVEDGMVLHGNGKLYTHPSPTAQKEGLLCSVRHFDKADDAFPGMPDELEKETLPDLFKPEKWTGRTKEMEHLWEKLPAVLKKEFNFAAVLNAARKETLRQNAPGKNILKKKIP